MRPIKSVVAEQLSAVTKDTLKGQLTMETEAEWNTKHKEHKNPAITVGIISTHNHQAHSLHNRALRMINRPLDVDCVFDDSES